MIQEDPVDNFRKAPATPESTESDWHPIALLLKERLYGRAADLIGRELASAYSKGDLVLVEFLSCAKRICQSCAMHSATAVWHRQAVAEIEALERDLVGHLLEIFSAIALQRLHTEARQPVRYSEDNPGANPASKKRTGSGLGQRIQAMLLSRLSGRVKSESSRTPAPEAGAAAPAAARRSGETAVVGSAPDAAPCDLAFYCLGPFQAFYGGERIAEWIGLKGICILKYLVAHRRKPILRDVLMDVFWPDADPEAARRNLHQAIYCLRQSFRSVAPEAQLISFSRDCYGLSPDIPLWVDAEEFETRVEAGRRMEKTGRIAEALAEYEIAEALYMGDFMEDEPYLDWPMAKRQYCRDLYIEILDRLAGHHLRMGNHGTVISLCRKALSYDSCCEEAHVRLMQSFIAQGQHQLALRQYHCCERALKAELDIAPSARVREYFSRLESAMKTSGRRFEQAG